MVLQDPSAWSILLIVFLFGVTIGSFLNVCIFRLPQHEDIVKEHSHCMSCGHRLAWYDLIPLFSWLLLRGRCRYCKARISVQYPLVEFLNGIGWVLIFLRNDVSVTSLCCCAAFSALLVLSVIDLRTFEIPDGCNLVILLAGVVNLAFHRQMWLGCLIGFVSVSGFLLLVAWISSHFIEGGAMGFGDIKLMAAAGLLLGGWNILFAFCAGCIAGSIVHVALMKLKGKGRMLAFGPYLSFGIALSMLAGNDFWSWYLGTLGL